jgi:hypothetical protein
MPEGLDLPSAPCGIADGGSLSCTKALAPSCFKKRLVWMKTGVNAETGSLQVCQVLPLELTAQVLHELCHAAPMTQVLAR